VHDRSGSMIEIDGFRADCTFIGGALSCACTMINFARPIPGTTEEMGHQGLMHSGIANSVHMMKFRITSRRISL
jgi:hypothetical protein